MADRPSLTQWLAHQQQCPGCTRAVNVEHVGFEETPGYDQAVALLYCEACNCGYEVLYAWQGIGWSRQFHLAYGPQEDKKLAKFKQRLANVTGVAA